MLFLFGEGGLAEEEGVVVAEVEDAVAALAGHLGDDVEADEFGEEAVDGGLAGSGAGGEGGAGGDWFGEEGFQGAAGGGCAAAEGLDLLLTIAAETVDGLEGLDPLASGLVDGDEEELDPADEVAAGADGGEGVVVLGAMLFQVRREVEAGLVEKAFADEVEGDEEASHAPVPVEEGVDGLELIVANGDANELGDRDLVVVPKGLEVAHEGGDLVVMRGDEDGVGEAGSANPVLAAAEFPRSLSLPTDSLHEGGVAFAEQAVGEGKGAQVGERLVHGCDVIADLLPVVALLGVDFRRVLLQGFVHFGLGAFDAAGGLGLFDDVHLDEEVEVGHDEGESIELSQVPVGLGEKLIDFGALPGPRAIDFNGSEALILKLLVVVAGVKVFELHLNFERFINSIIDLKLFNEGYKFKKRGLLRYD